MKKIIESLGISIKEFSTYYEIPYNTVRQWWNGDRTPPKWVIKLLNELIELKKNGIQLPITKNYYMIGIKTKHGYNEYICETKEKREEIKKMASYNYNRYVEFIEKDFIEII